jgi:hypothetical protein
MGARRSKYTLAPALIKVSRRPRHARYRPWFSLFNDLSVGILRRYQFSRGALLAPGAEEDTSVVGKHPHQLRYSATSPTAHRGDYTGLTPHRCLRFRCR